ncbi:DUF2384 domain-containing protein [Pseudoxanthomonas sacheonensis]|uniref:DUF2384 domain-containing protein n=1 Tax=Pseudoxanthomonas sacheonensis TaxID=443615 RepID=UPI0013D89841|nr:DUF2384 domain-containing protein [Pseudoxanthomonas sacheonensis]KAF1710183.1 DUF2384 domain-containing protein [Pseudoxanthomonas sacheonensis]
MREDSTSFAVGLREDAIISPKAYVERLHISMQRLADLAHVHHTALLHAPESEKVQDYMRNSISVIAMLLDFNGGDAERAIYWFRNVPLTELGGETAEHYVASGKAKVIRSYITNLAAGATG